MSAQTVVIESRRFGRIEVAPEQVLRMPGLPGFPEARRFVLCAHDRGHSFGWLICADVPDLAFVVADPWAFFPDYVADLDERHLRMLGVDDASKLEVLVIATVSAGETTLNLAAPLVIHAETREARQIILEKSPWSTRQPLPKHEATAGA